MQISGPKLRKLREVQDVRQADVARRMGVSVPRVATIESGRKDPGKEVAVRYLQAIEDVMAERTGEPASRVVLRIETSIYTFGAFASAPMMLRRHRTDVTTNEHGDVSLSLTGLDE